MNYYRHNLITGRIFNLSLRACLLAKLLLIFMRENILSMFAMRDLQGLCEETNS